MMWAWPAILVLASVGAWISLYFTLVYYKRMRPDSRFVPVFCRMGEQRCQSILNTRTARLLGVPNSLLGLGYYLGLIAMAVAVWISDRVYGIEAVRAAALAAALVSVFLFYSLVWRLRVPCPLCFTGQGINVILAALIWAGGL